MPKRPSDLVLDGGMIWVVVQFGGLRKSPIKCFLLLYSKIPILRPHLGLPKVVLKTTFGQSQRWSLVRGTLGVESEEKNNLNYANKVLNR